MLPRQSTNQKPEISNLTEAWTLPKLRKITRLTLKQILYLTRKFNDSIKHTTRWKHEAVAAEMERLREKMFSSLILPNC